jgi:hypothetical protein
MTKKELINLICEQLEIPQVNRMIETQITRFVTKHGYDYKDIGRALYYFVTVQKNKPDISKGIGIVPFVKEESTAYFEKLKREEQMKQRQGQEVKQELDKERKVFHVSPRKREIKNNKINIEDL